MAKAITDNTLNNTPVRKKKRTKSQIEAQDELEAARDADTARRLDTRQKVVLGAALVAMADRGDGEAVRMVERIKGALIRKADRTLFGLDLDLPS